MIFSSRCRTKQHGPCAPNDKHNSVLGAFETTKTQPFFLQLSKNVCQSSGAHGPFLLHFGRFGRRQGFLRNNMRARAPNVAAFARQELCYPSGARGQFCQSRAPPRSSARQTGMWLARATFARHGRCHMGILLATDVRGPFRWPGRRDTFLLVILEFAPRSREEDPFLMHFGLAGRPSQELCSSTSGRARLIGPFFAAFWPTRTPPHKICVPSDCCYLRHGVLADSGAARQYFCSSSGVRGPTKRPCCGNMGHARPTMNAHRNIVLLNNGRAQPILLHFWWSRAAAQEFCSSSGARAPCGCILLAGRRPSRILLVVGRARSILL